MWADLCLSSQEPAAAERTLATLHELGYSRVCWCSESTGKLDGLRAPVLPGSVRTDGLQQLSRLNIHVEEEHHVAHIHTSRDVLSTYDLVGVVPHSEAALERCLQPPIVDHIDLVSLPSAQRSPFVLKPALVQRAVRAGLHFELCYSAALRDGLSRRHLVSNLQGLVQLLLPKQRARCPALVVSSGADECRLLRSPHDVVNLLVLFGCHPSAAQQAVVTNPSKVLQRGARRQLPVPLAQALPSNAAGGACAAGHDANRQDGQGAVLQSSSADSRATGKERLSRGPAKSIQKRR